MGSIKANPGNGLGIGFLTVGSVEYQANESFLRAVGLGQVTGASLIDKFGRNPDVDTGTAEDVWNGGGDYTGQPVSDSETVEVFSADAADAAAGTGARTIAISGLDENWNEATETITMNGVTGVISTGTFRRVNRAWVVTAGSGGINAGQITVRHSTTTANIHVVMPTFGQTAIAAYTIPDAKTGYLVHANAQLARANGAAGSATATLRTRDTATADASWRSREITDITDGSGFSRPYAGVVSFPARTDVKWRVDSVSDNNTIVSAGFTILLIDD